MSEFGEEMDGLHQKLSFAGSLAAGSSGGLGKRVDA